jgi:hypothetical protein
LSKYDLPCEDGPAQWTVSSIGPLDFLGYLNKSKCLIPALDGDGARLNGRATGWREAIDGERDNRDPAHVPTLIRYRADAADSKIGSHASDCSVASARGWRPSAQL